MAASASDDRSETYNPASTSARNSSKAALPLPALRVPVIAVNSTVRSADRSASTPPGPQTPLTPIGIRPGTPSSAASATIVMANTAAISTAAATTVNSTVAAPRPPPSKLSMTTKEWVVPPRPKPGRKPATDTPPSKRKAQNRAAQRAFRERRAARVGELELQIDEQREEHGKVEQDLREMARNLEAELQAFKSRCAMLESMLEMGRQDRMRLESEVERLQSANLRNGSLSSVTASNTTASYVLSPAEEMTAKPPRLMQEPERDRVAPSGGKRPDPRAASQAFSISQIIDPPGCGSCEQGGRCACAEILADTALETGCGKCTVGSRCECFEETLKSAEMQSLSMHTKRPLSPQVPSASQDNKRPRTGGDPAPAIELASFYPPRDGVQGTGSVPQPPPSLGIPILPPTGSIQPSIPARDSCGFCERGTYCMCAEAARAVQGPGSQPMPVPEQQTQTPPPSEYDVVPPPMEVTSTGAIKLPNSSALRKGKAAVRIAAAARDQPNTDPTSDPSFDSASDNLSMSSASGPRCGENGPGTCAQCIADPKSGLFCRSLAANFARQRVAGSSSGQGEGGCCGGSGPGGGCCKSESKQAPTEQRKSQLSLSCADAYKTLSTHKNFDRASDDIGTWLPALKTQPAAAAHRTRGCGGGNGEGFLPIEVEAASIMSVLKEFDVRFGRGK